MEDNIFQAVQQKYSIVAVARDLGLTVKRVGSSYRSNSIDQSGRGENALALYEDTNTWHDYMLDKGGDITNLVAEVRFDGDIKQALQYLMPEWEHSSINRDVERRKELLQDIERDCEKLLNDDRNQYVRAREYLHSRRITDETIRELKIGVDPSCAEFRIRFPVWDGKSLLFYVTRRYDWTGRGENKEKPKYKNAPLNYYSFLRNAPLGLNTLKRDNDTLIITEGVFDWLAFYQEGYSVLASHGGDFGKLWKEVLEKIKNFKQVILAYDTDEAGQGFTYKAAQMLLKHRIPFSVATPVTKDVADYYQATGNLKAITGSARQGFKWFLQYIVPQKPYEELTVRERETALEKCKSFIKDIATYADSADVHIIIMGLRSYFPKDLVSGLFAIARQGPTQKAVADKIISEHNLKYNPRTGFYEYQKSGIWKQVDDETIEGYVEDALGNYATGTKLTSIRKLIQANSQVHSEVPVKFFNTQPLVSFLNGTLDIDVNTGKGTFREHKMSDFATVQLPIHYNPNAKCHNWLQFINDITNGREDDQKVLQEFAGYPLLPDCKFQKALMLKGGGSNGKSAFFNIISAILGGVGDDGRGFISSTDPSKWAKDFRLMPLHHSWLNISYDMENDLRGSEGILKKVVSGEVLEDSYKHKDPIPFNTRSKLMMACNYFPTVNDTSDGFMRRWLVVELNSHFVPKDKIRPFTNDKALDPYLEDKLIKELPGIFNWMLEGLQRLLKQKGFTHTANQDRLINEFRASNNPLYSFVEDKQEAFKGSDEGHIVPREKVYDMYSEWSSRNNVMPLPAYRFYSNMRSIFSSLSIPFSEEDNSWIFFYLGESETAA